MNILIVEDDPMVRDINAGFLRKINSNYKIYEASDVKSAKEVILSNSLDIVLLDIYLGEINGPALLKWIRDKELNVDVILITADNSAETIEMVLRLGAIDYIIKPFNFERFKQALNNVINRRRQLKSGEKITQDTLDKWIKKAGDKDLVQEKGINTSTYQTIKKFIKQSNAPLTAQKVSDSTDLARVTVRRYLEYMVEEGLVKEELNYGKVGRPQKSYLWIGVD
ncbi:response regulator [Proteinivorax hydrogeniformans]|uniref:Transcriptional regulatory protein n=1 Tax=Proteinivorax hydrogeniformans TaxID=1826727 RepID=A0AAU8HUN0_9FIRM